MHLWGYESERHWRCLRNTRFGVCHWGHSCVDDPRLRHGNIKFFLKTCCTLECLETSLEVQGQLKL